MWFYQSAIPSSLRRALNEFSMLSLDQHNEKKMKKIGSLKQECDVQNMAVIACSALWSPEI